MTYNTAFRRLEERLLEACDFRLQALEKVGWLDDETIDAIKDDEIKTLATSLAKKGYTSVKDKLENMIFTIYNDLGVEKELSGLYYDIVVDSKLNRDWSCEPVIRLRASYCDDGNYELRGLGGKYTLPSDISAKCLKALDFVDRCYLLSHTLNQTSDGDRKPIDDYVRKHLTDYDVIITINIDGDITYRRCDN